MVFDVAIAWERMQYNKQNKTVDQSMYDQKELQSIMDKAKGKKWLL